MFSKSFLTFERVINIVFTISIVVVLFVLLQVYNKHNQSTSRYDGSENAVEYELSERQQQAVNSEPLVLERESNRFRELRRLCGRERNGLIDYESNYCEQFERYQNPE